MLVLIDMLSRLRTAVKACVSRGSVSTSATSHRLREQAASQRHDGKLQRASTDPAYAPTSDSERRATMTVRAST